MPIRSPYLPSHRRTARTRTRGWPLPAIALVLLLAALLAPSRADAAVTVVGTPTAVAHGGDVTIAWTTSESASSELAWDVTPHTTFEEYPNDVSNPTTDLGLRHSRTIAGLPPGTYYFKVRARTEAAPGAPSPSVSGQVVVGAGATATTVMGDVVTDGAVTASTMRQEGAITRAWLAGSFTRIGFRSGAGVAVNATGASDTFPGAPRVEGGVVLATTDDGAGGWYIGGTFTQVGGVPARNVAHIFADGGVDPLFTPAGFGAGAVVRALDYDSVNSAAKQRLYVGGTFAWTEASVTSNNLVALFPSTTLLPANRATRDEALAIGTGVTGCNAALTSCTPATADVRALLVDPRPETTSVAESPAGLYVGGRFDKIGTEPYSNLAKLEFTGARAVQNATGYVRGTIFDPGQIDVPATFRTGSIAKGGVAQNAVVNSIALYDQRDDMSSVVTTVATWDILAKIEPTIAVGGDFDRVDHIDENANLIAAETHRNLVFINSSIGTQQVYVNIAAIGQSARYGGDPEGPPNAANGPVTSLTVVDAKQGTNYTNDALYVGGHFTQLGGLPRAGFGRFALSMRPATWAVAASYNPSLAGAVPAVDGMALTCTNVAGTVILDDCGTGATGARCAKVHVLGDFQLGTHARDVQVVNCGVGNSGTVDASYRLGTLLDATPKSIATSKGRLFIGGDFTRYEGELRPGIAQLNRPAHGSTTIDAFATDGPIAGGDVTTMSADANRLYLGGSFTSIGSHPARFLGAYERAGAVPVAGYAQPGWYVRSVLAFGGNLLVGGEFDDVVDGSGTPCAPTCKALAVVSPSGAPSRYFGLDLDGDVNAIVADGTDVYLGGHFGSVDGATGQGIARVDGMSGAVDPLVGGAIGKVDAIAVDATSVYFAGAYQYGASSLGGVAKLRKVDRALDTGFSPPAFAAGTAAALPTSGLVAGAGQVLAGGGFTGYTGDGVRHAARFDPGSGSLVSTFRPQPDGAVATMSAAGGRVLIGGAFTTFDGRADTGGLALVDLVHPDPDSTPPNASTLATTPAASPSIARTSTMQVTVNAGNDVGSGIESRTLQQQFAEFDPANPGSCLTGGAWTNAASITPSGVGTITPATTLTGLAPGCYQYRLVAMDNAGNARTDDAPGGWIRLDDVAPTGAASVPAVVLTQGTAAADVTIEDVGSGVASWKLVASWNPTGQLCAGTDDADVRCTWSSAAVAEGSHTISLTVEDAAGNVFVGSPSSITIDHTAPVIGSVILTPGTGASTQHVEPGAEPVLWFDPAATGSVDVDVSASDGSGVGIGSIAFGATVDLVQVPGATANERTFEWTAGTAADETIDVDVLDWVGNLGTAQFHVRADATAPTGAIAYAGGTDVPAFAVTAPADAGSGVATSRIERREAALASATTCAAWSPTWTTMAWSAPAATFTDASASRTTCYQYRLVVVDNVGHVATFDAGATVITDRGVTISEGATPGTRSVEGGVVDSYAVRLDRAPVADVVIAISGDAQASVTPSTLTFTSTNWNTPQDVVVTAIDDDLDEPDVTTSTIVHVVTSADPEFAGRPPIELAVSIVDDDVSRVIVSPTSGVQLAEAGLVAGTYEVQLASEPVGNVTIDVATDTQVSASPATLTFDATDWSQSQSVTVTPIDDPDIEGATTSVVSHVAASATDPNYDGLAVDAVTTRIADDDLAGLEVESSSAPEVSEGDASDVERIRVRLRARPTSPVTVTASNEPAQLDVGAAVTFEPASWDSWQSIDVRALQDVVAEGSPHTAVLRLGVTTTDAHYAGVTSSTISFAVLDDDIAAYTLVGGENWRVDDAGVVQLDEGSAAGTVIGIRATTDPQADIVVRPTVTRAGLVSISPATATIPAGSRDRIVQFTIKPVNNDVRDTSKVAASITWTMTTTDLQYGSVALADTRFVIADDDVAQRTIRETGDDTPASNPTEDGGTPDTPTRDAAPTQEVSQPTGTPIPDAATPVVDQATDPQSGPPTDTATDEPREVVEEDDAAPPARRHASKRSLRQRLTSWSKDNKIAAASVAASLAAGVGGVAQALASKGLVGSLKGMGGFERILDHARQLHPRRLSKRQRQQLQSLRKRRRRDAQRVTKTRRRRNEDEDILDRLSRKYEPTHDDPLRAFERGPGTDRPDILEQLDDQVHGFEVDDRWRDDAA